MVEMSVSDLVAVVVDLTAVGSAEEAFFELFESAEAGSRLRRDPHVEPPPHVQCVFE